jgi:hypothetical protein
VTGQPGRNAAAVILEDDGKTLEQVVANGCLIQLSGENS